MALLLAATAALRAAPARADQVDALAELLGSRATEKERVAAVTALGRLGDKRALRPLVTALRDPSATIRALAAAALGKLGHRAALPALRAATADADEAVRARAREAVLAVAEANHVAPELPGAPAPAAAPAPKAAARHQAGFGRAPRVVEAHPDLYVLVNSTTDDSPGKADKATRKANGEVLRRVLGEALRGAPAVTAVAAEAARFGIEERHLDVSVTRLDVSPVGANMEIAAELRLAISDRHGKMLSFVSGGAKVQIPRRTYDPRYLADLRREALDSAVRGLFDKLLAHLRRPAQS